MGMRNPMFEDPSLPDPTASVAIRLCVAFAFVVTGLDKFVAAAWAGLFAAIGLGQWFRYFTGVVEIAGGLLFLIPAATPVGAAMLVATMIGAMAVHVVVLKHPADALFPGVYLAGVVLAYGKLRPVRGRAMVARERGAP